MPRGVETSSDNQAVHLRLSPTPRPLLIGLAVAALVIAGVAHAIREAPRIELHWVLLGALVIPVAWAVWAVVRSPRTMTIRRDEIRVASLVRRWIITGTTPRRIEELPNLLPRRSPLTGKVLPDRGPSVLRLEMDVGVSATLPRRPLPAMSLTTDSGGRPVTLLVVIDAGSPDRMSALRDALAAQHPHVPIDPNPPLAAQRSDVTAVWSLGELEWIPRHRNRLGPFSWELARVGAAVLAISGVILGATDGIASFRIAETYARPYAEYRDALRRTPGTGPLERSAVLTRTELSDCERDNPGLWGTSRTARSLSIELSVPFPVGRNVEPIDEFDEALERDLPELVGFNRIPSDVVVLNGRIPVTVHLNCVDRPRDGWPAAQRELGELARDLVGRIADRALRGLA